MTNLIPNIKNIKATTIQNNACALVIIDQPHLKGCQVFHLTLMLPSKFF